MTNAPPIFILANDKVISRYIMLAGSLKYFGYSNTIFVLPFDENIRLIRAAATVFGHLIYEAPLSPVDAFSRELYDRDPPANPYPACLGNLRKMAFLSYPSRAIYLDCDTVVTCHPDLFNAVFGAIEPASGTLGIGYINTSPDGVYEDNAYARTIREGSHFICAGMLSKSEGTLDISSIREHLLDERIVFYHKIRRRGGYVDQPLWNYLVDTGFLRAVDLLAREQASRVTSCDQRGLRFAEDGAASVDGKSVLLFHMAGPVLKKTKSCRFVWQGMLWEGLRIIRDAAIPEAIDIAAAMQLP
jgi:hypothetical protein